MTHHPDPTAMREAAERVRRAAETGVVAVYGHYKLGPDANDYRQKYSADLVTLADAYLALTGPTPLTFGVILQMGFVNDSRAETLKTDTLTISYWPKYPAKFRFYLYGDERAMIPLLAQPRTAGELRQLLQRLEK